MEPLDLRKRPFALPRRAVVVRGQFGLGARAGSALEMQLGCCRLTLSTHLIPLNGDDVERASEIRAFPSGCCGGFFQLAAVPRRGFERSLGRGQLRRQTLTLGFIGLQVGGGTPLLCPRIIQAVFQAGAIGRRAPQVEVGLNALTKIAEPGADRRRGAGRGGGGEELLHYRKLILADSEYSQAVVMEEGEMRMGGAKLVPQAPDPEIPLSDINVVKQDDATVRELGSPAFEIMPNGIVSMAAIDMKEVDAAICKVGESLIKCASN